MLRDIRAGKDPQVKAVIAQIIASKAEIIALQGIDYDLENLTLKAFAQALATQGAPFPYIYAAPPNAGRATTIDLDGDGRIGGPGDNQGYGRYFGQGSMALLSQHPILADQVQDFTPFKWLDLPGATLPQIDGAPFPTAEAQAAQRLFSHGAWAVPIAHPTLGRVTVLTYHATPPVFDGPEDRNGLRNLDETRFWSLYLNGSFGPVPQGRMVLMGDANLDPDRGDGIRAAMKELIDHPALQDPLPGLPTVNWSQTGPMRVDYVLPSADWTVTAAQVSPLDPAASRHSLVWAEVEP